MVNSLHKEVLDRERAIAVMAQDFVDYRDFRKHISFVCEKPEVTVVMGYDTMVPLEGPGAVRSGPTGYGLPLGLRSYSLLDPSRPCRPQNARPLHPGWRHMRS